MTERSGGGRRELISGAATDSFMMSIKFPSHMLDAIRKPVRPRRIKEEEPKKKKKKKKKKMMMKAGRKKAGRKKKYIRHKEKDKVRRACAREKEREGGREGGSVYRASSLSFLFTNCEKY